MNLAQYNTRHVIKHVTLKFTINTVVFTVRSLYRPTLAARNVAARRTEPQLTICNQNCFVHLRKYVQFDLNV